MKYYPKNYIPIYGGGESLLHFILRSLFFPNKKYRGDVFDPFTCVLYEIQKDSKEIRKKKRIFNRSSEIEFVKFINPLGFSEAEEFERLLTKIWDETQGVIEVI